MTYINSIRGATGRVSTDNTSTTPLNAGLSYTGTWEDVSAYDSITVAVTTDQNGTYTVQFSPDGTNIDSALTRYYNTNQIEAPHRFTVARQYMRVIFNNTSASNQTYLRLQVLLGIKTNLNVPTDAVMAQDYDAIVVRPTDYKSEVALGLRQGAILWNKFGFNTDVDIGTELIASWGGTFTPMTTARTLSVVSTSTDDDDGGIGANSVIIYGIDENRQSQTVIVTLDGTTPVVTAESWLGVNRMSIYVSGSNTVNVGTITATATTDLTIQGQIPVGVGTSQQCIFHIQADHQALFEFIRVNLIRFGSGTEPLVTIKAWVFSHVTNSKYEILRDYIDGSINNHIDLSPSLPFPVTESSTFWLEATSTRDDTNLSGRFSLIETKNVDA